MAIDVELKTLKQSNTTWPSTFKASNRFPIVANRVFATLEKAQQYVDDTAADASAYKGIVLAVVEDSIAKNNGVYYVESVAMAEGETGKLVKVGGTETETAKNYSAAKTLSNTLVLGQLIKVNEEETITEGEGEEAKEVTYQAGFYIVEGAGVISALATSTGSDDEVGALKGRVNALETTVGNEEAGIVKDVADLKEAVEAIEIPEVPVQDVTVDGVSVLNKETGVAAIDLTPYEKVADADLVRGRMDAAEEAIEGLDAAVKEIVIPEVPVQDVTVNGASVLGEDGVAAIELPDFATFETVEEANKVRERMGAAEGAITALQGKDTELAAAIDGKVAKEDGKRLMTDAEGTKLAGIVEGAQVNVIEVVKVNGQALSVAAGDKSVDVIVPTAPVQGVAAEEKVLSLDGDKLKTTLTLAYVPASEGQDAVLRLQGKDGAVVSSIDATAFVKDGMLEGAKLEGPKEGESGEKYLVLTFNTAAGKEDIRMDVSSLLDYYAAGDGLALDGKTFAIKLDATAESYLKVTTNGLAVADALWTKVDEKDSAVLTSAQGYADTKKTEAITAAEGYTDTAIANLKLDETYEKAGVAQGLINALDLANTYEAKGAAADALADAQGYTDDAIEALDLANTYEAKGYADEAIEALNLGETYEAKGTAAELLEAHEEAMETVLAGKANVGDSYLKAEAEAKFVAQVEGERLMTTAEGTKLAGVEEGAQVNVIEAIKVNGVKATVAEGSKLAEVTVDGTKVLVGADIQGDVKNPETGEISKETVYGSNSTLAAVLQGIQDSVSVAVSGGLTSVVAGNGVEVSAVASNKQTVSVKVSAAEGNMITADANGIYAAMYYDGDDAE